MATAIMAALALLTEPGDTPPPAEILVLSGVLITATGDPTSLPYAGWVAPYLALEVTTTEGEAMVAYMLRMEPDEPAPPLGGLCTMEALREPLLGGNMIANFRNAPLPGAEEPVLVVAHFDCRISSDSPIIDPAEN